jgi:hypothetical protein
MRKDRTWPNLRLWEICGIEENHENYQVSTVPSEIRKSALEHKFSCHSQ